MNMSRTNIHRALLITALCTGVTAWAADEKTPSGAYGGQRHQDKDSKAAEGESAIGHQPKKTEKATGLIGMQVKNQAGEQLGKIRDVVIDFQGERVAYAVLGTGGLLSAGEKMHAVPLKAFQPSSDGTYLTLNADKDKLAKAEGFDKDNWPSATSPAWGAEPFWQESTSDSPPDRNLETKPTESD